MDELKGIFDYLKSQHAQLKESFDQCEKAFEENRVQDFLIHLRSFYEHLVQHHQEEFDVLIRTVGVHPRCREGGPFCTYYIDVYGFSRPLEEAQQFLIKVDPEARKVIIPEKYEQIFAMNSPATIPLEEHLAMEHLVSHFLTWEPDMLYVKKEVIAIGLVSLGKWLRFNSQKEEQCFFSLCTNILSSEDKRSLSSEWLKKHPA